MKVRKLHIVSFDVPYPADYGGVIDVFYKIKALHKAGVEITLHCFEYGRGKPPELEKYANTVFYYKRKKSIFDFLKKDPFIVVTRSNKSLLENLLLDDAPILFEGLHTTYFLNSNPLANRIKMVRTHNIEHNYYNGLAKNAKGWIKWFFKLEAKKLMRYEKCLASANHVFTLQNEDLNHFKNLNSNSSLLPVCIPEINPTNQIVTLPYVLFHGNLSVFENQKTVNWICENIAPENKFEIRIAGKNPPSELITKCAQLNIKIIANPTEEALNKLIQNARVHIFRTNQDTGIKLKLINVLSKSGHDLVNSKMIHGTNLASIITVLETKNDFLSEIERCMNEELSNQAFCKRQALLAEHFNINKNIQAIINLIDTPRN